MIEENRFTCLDCEVDTNKINEYYMVHREIWLQANPVFDGMLCVGCLETRLGRQLSSSDFTDFPVNKPWFDSKSERLLDRLGVRQYA